MVSKKFGAETNVTADASVATLLLLREKQMSINGTLLIE
ncbi:hypothetical protein VCR4J2_280015 [Vibrio coralliirubri]|nr:hypothetical protein VCR4J2_280015 [Vibrio coralliirubri]